VTKPLTVTEFASLGGNVARMLRALGGPEPISKLAFFYQLPPDAIELAGLHLVWFNDFRIPNSQSI
jgi:hypothetical protein